jgi:hypothetical protein
MCTQLPSFGGGGILTQSLFINHLREVKYISEANGTSLCQEISRFYVNKLHDRTDESHSPFLIQRQKSGTSVITKNISFMDTSAPPPSW